MRVLLEGDQPMSAWDPSDPDRLIYPYLELFAAISTLRPPGRALVIGEAGGSLSRWLVQRGWSVDGVELERAVLRLSRRWLGADPRVRTHVADGRAWLERRGGPWDLIALDACTADYIPPRLLTVEWFTTVRDALAPGGIAAQNAWSRAPRADDELATWRAVWPRSWIVDAPDAPGENRLLFAGPEVAPALDGLRVRPLPADVGSARTDAMLRP